MKDYKVLALDETGKASFDHLSKNFVLSGFILPEAFRPKLDKSIRKLKKKHFNDEEIVLHCRDILRKKGPFACLRESSSKELGFWKVTSLSLVNKANLDIDIQMADILAIMADIVYKMKIGIKKKPTKVEAMMKKLINRKMADKNNPGIFEILI